MKGILVLFRSVFGPALLVWLFAEFVAFYLVAQVLGLGGALLAGLGTTLFGFTLMRENAGVAMQRVRAAIDGSAPRDGAMAEGMIGGFGALLLILPGFLSDIVGLVLTIPSVRDDLALRMRSRHPSHARRGEYDAIDLSPGEWRITDSSSDRRTPR